MAIGRTIRFLLAILGLLTTIGCAAMTQALTEFNRGLESAVQGAPTKTCPSCNKVYQALLHYCPDDGTALEVNSSPAPPRAVATPAPAAPASARIRQQRPPQKVEVAPAQSTQQVVLILVHGTLSIADIPIGTKDWTDPESPDSFAAACAAGFKERNPQAEVFVVPFPWDGDNTNRDRHNGGLRLAEILDRAPKGVEVHIIAHSHGGNVALRALTLAKRKSQTVTMLGTPHLGVAMTVQETGRTYRLPLYLPTPEQAAKTALLNINSPQDSVATIWASVTPGTTFSDLEYTNAEEWRRFWKLDVATVRAPRRNGRGNKVVTVQSTGMYDFMTGDGVICREIPESLGLNVGNFSVPAKTFLDVPRSWVHSQLHSPAVGLALGRVLAQKNSGRLLEEVGTLRN